MKTIRNMKVALFGNLLVLAGLFAVNPAGAQTAMCIQLGAITSCDVGGQQTIQAQLGATGTILHPNGTATPYVVIPSTPRTSHRTAPIFVAPEPPPVSAPSTMDSLYYSAPMPSGYGGGQ